MIALPAPLRSIFFFLVVFTFFVTTGSVLFHTFGYRFSLERGIFIYTGSITLGSNPSDITVTINGEKVSEKGFGVLNNSLHISGLTPGEYFVEASAPGYQSWTKKAVVESGRSTEFWNVQLTKQEPEWQNFRGTENALKVIASPRSNIFAVVKKNETEYTIDILNTDTGESEQIFSTLESLFRQEGLEPLWSPDGGELLVPIAGDLPAYYLVDIRSKNAILIRPSFPNASPIKNVRFDPTAENTLLLQNDRQLYRLDLSMDSAIPVLLSENVAAFDISGRTLYYLSSDNGIVYSSILERDVLEPLQITVEPLPMGKSLVYQISIYDSERVALLEKSAGTLSVFNSKAEDQLKTLSSAVVQGMQFSDDGKKLLFFTDNEISVYFVRDWEVQPSRQADSLVQIGRFSQNLDHVQWTKDYEHVLFTLDTDLKVIELDNRDRRNILDIATLPAAPLQVYSDFGNNKLLIVAPEQENTPYRVRSLVFPEPSGFFSFR